MCMSLLICLHPTMAESSRASCTPTCRTGKSGNTGSIREPNGGVLQTTKMTLDGWHVIDFPAARRLYCAGRSAESSDSTTPRRGFSPPRPAATGRSIVLSAFFHGTINSQNVWRVDFDGSNLERLSEGKADCQEDRQVPRLPRR